MVSHLKHSLQQIMSKRKAVFPYNIIFNKTFPEHELLATCFSLTAEGTQTSTCSVCHPIAILSHSRELALILLHSLASLLRWLNSSVPAAPCPLASHVQHQAAL